MTKKNQEEKKGFFSNWIVKNLLIALVIGVVLIVGAMIYLNIATQHNREATWLCRQDVTHLYRWWRIIRTFRR